MQRVHQHPVLFGSFLAVVLAALTATAPRPAQAGGGKIYVSEAEYGSYASDKEMNAAIKKQSKTSFKGDGTWPLNLMIFLNAPAGADKINVVYYDVTKKREQIDFAEVVDAAVEPARRRHPEARIELRSPEERQTVNGWPDGLRLLVDNLLENAIRHGGSTVRVTLRRLDGECLLLSVEDDGPGIPSVDREHIFERFQRGSGAVGPGSVLGLALVAQQASLHDGSVELGDSPLGGASFEVRLPLAGVHAA